MNYFATEKDELGDRIMPNLPINLLAGGGKVRFS
jgi:hypothetical protein